VIRNRPKRTTFTNSGLAVLQMVSKLGSERSTSDGAGPRRGMDYKIPHWLERRMKHFSQGCENLSLVDAF